MREFEGVVSSVNEEPQRNKLWILRVEDRYVFKIYGAKGWEEIGKTDNTSISWNSIEDKPSIPSAYSLNPATQSKIGGVKKTASIADLTSDTNEDIVLKINEILTKLRAAGIITT